MNETTKFTEDVVIAQFRFSLIAPVIQGLYPDASATAYFKRITEKPIRLPNGCTYQYSYKTVEKWATLYRNGGMEALLLVNVPTVVFHVRLQMLPLRKSTV